MKGLYLTTMPTTHYDTHESGSSGGDYETYPTMKVRPYTTIDHEVESVYASDADFGQSLGVNFIDVELVDGAFYIQPDSGKYTLFSWKNVAEMSPVDRYERGEEPSADDAPNIVTRTYFGDDYTYELVAARVPEITDDDDVAVEATSKRRSVEMTEDGTEFGDWEELGGDSVPLPNTVVYFDADENNGASVSSTVVAETLTSYGEDAIGDRDDYQNWLDVPIGENILRDDLDGRRMRFFIVQRESDESEYNYNLPIFVDKSTDERIAPNNRSEEGGTGNNEPEDDSAVQEAEKQDAGTYPEPLAEFVSSGRRLELSENRASKLLEEFVDDADNSLTWAMVENNGGEDEIVAQVV